MGRSLRTVRNTKNSEGITGVFSCDDNDDMNRTDLGAFQIKDGKFQFLGLIGADTCQPVPWPIQATALCIEHSHASPAPFGRQEGLWRRPGDVVGSSAW